MKNFTSYLIIVFVLWVIMSGNFPAYRNLVRPNWHIGVNMFSSIFGGSSSSSSNGASSGGISGGITKAFQSAGTIGTLAAMA